MQLLSFGRVAERQWACFHGVIGLFVAARLHVSVFFAVNDCWESSHIEPLRISLPRSIGPFLEPLEQQRIGALGWHGVGGIQGVVD